MPGATHADGTATSAVGRVLLYGALAAGVFAAGLLVTEPAGELGLDIDFKPFFLPYLVIAAIRFDERAVAASVGAAVGEGVLDLVEGYELDDPFGFVGYVVGFLVFGWVLREVAPDESDRRWQALACVCGAGTQAAFEGAAFYLLSDSGVSEALVSVVGNTVTHGVVMGAVPFVLLAPAVLRRFGE
ncbi:hypothetical protein [Halobaculum lipolyticum]|uniref:Rod shape-determining protein MreD n=1 Tax=Halobaculum lipolyticum TaxID=3032001 RepID=A0ABD5W4H6_9EURY|nr:hypothetical protein [Halobaculum sp. DT31]